MQADDFDAWQETIYLLRSLYQRPAAEGSRRP